jgi:hypothetical protein
MPPDIRNWLPEGHLAWFVLDAVADMNLGEFYWAYRRDGVGRRAYDPAMMACGPLASGVCGSRYAWGRVSWANRFFRRGFRLSPA